MQSLAGVQTEPHRKRNHTRLKTDGVLTLCSERCAEARTPGGAHDNDKVFDARGHNKCMTLLRQATDGNRNVLNLLNGQGKRAK